MPTYANIGGTRKTVSSWYNNIGGARKEIQIMYANVGNTRKIIYESGIDYWSISYNSSGTLSSSTRYSRMASTSATVNSSGTFTLQNATSTKGRPAAGTFMVKVNNGSSTTTTGTILYYFYNSTGGYYAFDTNVSNTSSTAVSRVKSTTYTSDVVYDSSNKKLLLKGLLVPNYYRWEKWETTTNYSEATGGSGTINNIGIDTDTNEYINRFNSYEIGSSTYGDGEFRIYDYDTINSQYFGIDYDVGDSIMNGYSYASFGYPYNSNGYITTNIIYKGLKITSISEGYATCSYTSYKYLNPSSSTSSLSGYVFSPNSSAYTTGSTYKNKTTL